MSLTHNTYRTRARLLFTLGCIGVLFFAFGQLTSESLGIHIVLQRAALVTGIVCLLSSWSSAGRARALAEFFDPALLLAHWSYTEEEWELYLQARGFTSKAQRKNLQRCDARVTAGGVYFTGLLRMWRDSSGGLGNVFITDGPVALITFSYTLPRGGRSNSMASYEIILPVPRARRYEAEALVTAFHNTGRIG